MRTTTSLSGEQAVARLEAMLQSLEPEVEHAIRVEASLEAANDQFRGELQDVSFAGAQCLQTVQHVMSINLAITVAKLYERPSVRKGRQGYFKRRAKRWDGSDVASIPLVVSLLHDTECQRVLRRRARDWTPSMPHRADANEATCVTYLQRAHSAYVEAHRVRRTLKAVKAIRNESLAHIRAGSKSPNLPRYRDLFDLVDAAKLIVGSAILAVLGVNDVFDDLERHVSEEALAFWGAAIPAAIAANRWDRPPG